MGSLVLKGSSNLMFFSRVIVIMSFSTHSFTMVFMYNFIDF
jgi:hypothetical protein